MANTFTEVLNETVDALARRVLVQRHHHDLLALGEHKLLEGLEREEMCGLHHSGLEPSPAHSSWQHRTPPTKPILQRERDEQRERVDELCEAVRLQTELEHNDQHEHDDDAEQHRHGVGGDAEPDAVLHAGDHKHRLAQHLDEQRDAEQRVAEGITCQHTTLTNGFGNSKISIDCIRFTMITNARLRWAARC